MLKKIFVTALLMALSFIGSQIFSSNVCSAIPEKEICLGRLTFGDKPDKVTKMYGEPTSRDWNVPIGKNMRGDIWRYGDSVEIVFYSWHDTEKEKKIVSIKVSANNGWQTPSGLAVGMHIEDAIRMYGKPVSNESFVAKGVDIYCYGGDRIPDAYFWIVCDKTSHKILKLCVRGYGIPNIGEYNLDGMIKWLLK